MVICTSLWVGVNMTTAFLRSLDDRGFGSMPDIDVVLLISLPYLKKGLCSLSNPLSESASQLQ